MNGNVRRQEREKAYLGFARTVLWGGEFAIPLYFNLSDELEMGIKLAGK